MKNNIPLEHTRSEIPRISRLGMCAVELPLHQQCSTIDLEGQKALFHVVLHKNNVIIAILDNSYPGQPGIQRGKHHFSLSLTAKERESFVIESNF